MLSCVYSLTCPRSYIRRIHTMLWSVFSKMLSLEFIKCYPVYILYTCILFNALSYLLGMLVCSWNVLACLSMQLKPMWERIYTKTFNNISNHPLCHFVSSVHCMHTCCVENVTQMIIQGEILQLYLNLTSRNTSIVPKSDQSEDLGKAVVIHFFWPFHFYFLQGARQRKVRNKKRTFENTR